LAIQKFHGDECFGVLLADVVDGANVGMVQSGCCLGFALETREGLRVFRDVIRKKFQGNEVVKANVFGFLHNAHAATTNLSAMR
jgi:hypothetical protein